MNNDDRYGDLYTFEKWVEANCAIWNCQAKRIFVGSAGAEQGEIILYFRKGKIFHPPVNTYGGFAMKITPTEKTHRIIRQGLDLTNLCRLELERYNCKTWHLPPCVHDVRSFTWNQWIAIPRYTYIINFDGFTRNINDAVSRQIKKAIRSGYKCLKQDDWKATLLCMRDTEERKKFSCGVDLCKLEMANSILGEDCLRCYVCYSRDGKPAAALVVAWPGFGLAFGWIGGTSNKHLQSGATQLIMDYVLDDLRKTGCTGLDLCGANIPGVQSYKSGWNGELRAYFCVRRQNTTYLIREFAKIIRDKINSRF